MIRTAYKLIQGDEFSLPFIEKVNITDLDGKSWREVKKELRDWYLNNAKSLRSVTEKSYFAASETAFEEVDPI